MSKLFILAVTVSAVFIVSCGQHDDAEVERATIISFHDECLKAQLAGNVDCFSEDGQWLPPDALPIKGREAIREAVSQAIEDPNFSVSHDIVDIEVSGCGDLASIHYNFVLTMSAPDGDPVTERGKAIHILKKQPEVGWKILIDIWNADTTEMHTESEVQADLTVNRDVQAILALEQDVFAAQNAGDLEGWLSFFTEDVLIMPPNEPALRGKGAVRAHNSPLFQKFDLHEETDEREVEVAGDLGYIRAHWKWVLTPKNGDEVITDIGSSIWIVHRQADGFWKISKGIYNSDKPIDAP